MTDNGKLTVFVCFEIYHISQTSQAFGHKYYIIRLHICSVFCAVNLLIASTSSSGG